MRPLWILPAVHVLASGISGYFYGRHLFALARAFHFGQPAPDPPVSQMIFWLFNLPCLMTATVLSDILPWSWQPQDYTRAWLAQPAVLFICAVGSTGVWAWLGAQWEVTGERVTWWRWALAAAGATLAAGIVLHTRTPDAQVIPFIVWPLLVALCALRFFHGPSTGVVP